MAAASSQAQVLASVKRSLQLGAYSDLTITCGNDTYKVHKVIVFERADFFARALKFGGQETENSTIDLPEDEPAIIKLLVQYIYEGEYDPLLPVPDSQTTTVTESLKSVSGSGCDRCNSMPELHGKSDQLLVHAKLYEIADKYDVVGLRDLVLEKFSRACKHFWDDAKFAIAAHHAYSTTLDYDEGLRQIVSATISTHMELVEKPEVTVLLTQFNGLALGILKEKIKEYGWGKGCNERSTSEEKRRDGILTNVHDLQRLLSK